MLTTRLDAKRACWLALAVAALASFITSHAGADTTGAAEASSQTTLFDLQDAIGAAQPGDVIRVPAGVYTGPIIIDKPLTLIGVDRPVIDAGESGNAVEITAPDVTLKGFLIRATGESLDRENAGVSVTGARAHVENNILEDVLFGVYLKKAPGSVVIGNVIGGKDIDLARRGDALRFWSSSDSLIENNQVRDSRDVVIWFSDRVTIRNNLIKGGRYGLHFMYSDDNVIEGNRIVGNSVGSFLMYSKNLTLKRNLFARNRGPSGYGVGLKDMDNVVADNNVFVGNRIGVHIDNSPSAVDVYDTFTNNVFAYNDIGIAFLPSVKRNRFYDNSFIENIEQIAILGGGSFKGNEFTVNGRGNFWSDYRGYDLDGDGVGDLPYVSESLFENLMDRKPILRLFLLSPAQQAIELAAKSFPIVKPHPKLTDDAPLMQPIPALVTPEPAASTTPMLALAAALLTGAALTLTSVTVRPGRRRHMLTAATDRSAPSAEPADETHMPTIATNKEMIRIDGLTKRFGRTRAVNDLSFTVRQGEATALWGPNGAGKTTVIKCLMSLLRHRGQIHVAGRSSQKQGKLVRRDIGYVPQELAFDDLLTVRQTLRFFARLKRAPAGRVQPVLEEIGLAEHARKKAGALSGGMKQRLALGIALLADPPLLVLDEPTSNLDAAARDAFLALLLDLKRRGKTILFTSHRVDEVLALADRVLSLDAGALEQDCAPEALLHSDAARRTLRLLIDPDSMDRAAEALQSNGFSPERNGRWIHLTPTPGDKARAIRILMDMSIVVRDFELDADEADA